MTLEQIHACVMERQKPKCPCGSHKSSFGYPQYLNLLFTTTVGVAAGGGGGGGGSGGGGSGATDVDDAKKSGSAALATATEVKRVRTSINAGGGGGSGTSTVGGDNAVGTTAYLRPETAQGAYINFANVVASQPHRRLPLGVAQVGKSFRNEISPGNFIFRTREFEQMELQYYCRPVRACVRACMCEGERACGSGCVGE
jgi:hypothetical protein